MKIKVILESLRIISLSILVLSSWTVILYQLSKLDLGGLGYLSIAAFTVWYLFHFDVIELAPEEEEDEEDE